jgi:Dolichyl-phosphate-mannose-protein mannosyltransferase
MWTIENGLALKAAALAKTGMGDDPRAMCVTGRHIAKRIHMRALIKRSWIAAFLGLVAFYFAIPELQTGDSHYMIATADLLLRTGSLDMRPLARADKGVPLPDNYQFVVAASALAPEIVARAKAAGVDPLRKVGAVDYYSTYFLINNVPDGATTLPLATMPPLLPFFPTWPSFAATPVSLVTAMLGAPVFDGATFREDRNQRYQRIIAAVLVAAAVFFFYLAARCLTAWPFALGLSAWLALGPLLSNTSRALWTDTFALPLSFVGLYIFTRVILTDRPMRYWPTLLAAVLSLAFMMKPVYAVPSAMLGLLVLASPKVSFKLKASFVAVCAVFAALFIVTSFATYGNILPPYFAPSRVAFFDSSRLLGVLFSPGRGALWFMPSLFVACCAPLLVWRDRTLFVTSIVAVAAVVAAVLTVANFNHWWGGGSFGPRILQFALPAVALLALLLLRETNLRGVGTRTAILALCGAIAGWESFVHISGVTSPRGWEWNGRPVNVDVAQQRLWDWSDPQFLAAFRPARPAAGIAEMPRDGWVSMASACSDHYDSDGISGRGPEYRWTDGDRAVLLFLGAPENAGRFAIELWPFLDTSDSAQHLSFALNGVEMGAAVLTLPQWTRLEFDVPPGILKSVNMITLKLPDARAPSGGAPEKRRLGVAIRRFVVTAEPDASSLPIAEVCR